MTESTINWSCGHTTSELAEVSTFTTTSESCVPCRALLEEHGEEAFIVIRCLNYEIATLRKSVTRNRENWLTAEKSRYDAAYQINTLLEKLQKEEISRGIRINERKENQRVMSGLRKKIEDLEEKLVDVWNQVP